MTDGRHLEISKRLYLRNGLTDQHKILYCDTYALIKIQDGGQPPF